ncbi:hypothetical protein AB685_23725 [Bacillus sp. LL01]|uniref:hypothetical protein n=1 Tax=Bacillus sp. LL01 TaxID=1665556 RepID=UPI00064D5916|nr:hypothetical protein [Bacillus sp. LL01]KMJ56111.1 hypothetical protein AB685_23725 [Bacillus sp. LL01]
MRSFRLGFSLIFWGLFIALLDFEINLVSILPGFIGFIFILFAIQKVGKEDNEIKKLVPWVNVLIPLSAMEWFSSFFIRPNEKMEEAALPINPLLLGWFSLLEIALLVVTILFVVKLMNYYIDLLKERKQFEWHERFVSRKLFLCMDPGRFGRPSPFSGHPYGYGGAVYCRYPFRINRSGSNLNECLPYQATI